MTCFSGSYWTLKKAVAVLDACGSRDRPVTSNVALVREGGSLEEVHVFMLERQREFACMRAHCAPEKGAREKSLVGTEYTFR